ncbi:MAG: cell wall hydrolase [Novosphingobium sp. 16-62-11]|uniref:cell wall hydrolase n=1 Tax=Novosphingobium sp. 17-62-19 TaxID=1970406 RepID=UPI000BC77C5C|nr:cell wall hydrolase [Novosphingobium sp. 17-62-19]OYZ43600.1 MAG: cell wall hydrolase [Novosphingobium sp. 16-62-11]OZA17775.1 MAG: cell wall hydrolase [Novosphingobium sp. 17-62-19]OZA71007.1 MAG: cell wall hydrolase [Sphingomonadales bacterium 39-62-4]HQS96049.1 cell wall hydrolase [Novosphingobium sp.]
MSKKFKYAATLSLAATFITTLLSTGGSQAAAQSMNAPVAIAATFISQPVVQPLADVQQDAVADRSEANASSLAELVAETDIPAALSKELECLAGAVFFEAKGESLAGQLAVGRVIVARSNSGRFPASYCGVVYQPSQFSFVRGRSMPAINRDSRAWQTAVRIARIADEGQWKSPVEGAMFFHATYVSPRWGKTRMAKVDGHVFYR